MKIAIINGPNLNMLGRRNKDHYGSFTLEDLNNLIKKSFNEIEFEFYQSNHEGFLIDFIQTTNADALLINAGAYTHTSIAIRDALEVLTIPKAEVHLSDITNREAFRNVNFIKDVVDNTFFGKKEQSYLEAIHFLVEKNKVLK